MGVLQKAYTFVKKHWSTDDDVYPDDLNRYEDGIEELYNRATEQDKHINVLSSLQNGFKLYKDFAEIGDSINNNTPLQTLIETMQDCSILICNSNGGTAYKGLFGTLIVHKRDNWHADLKLTVDSGKAYTAYYNKDNGVGLRDFEEIATTSKTDISSSSLLNGWTMWGNGYGDNLVGCKTGKQVQLNGLLRCGVKTQNTLILTLPEELRPTCSIIKNVSCYPYGTATIEIQSVGNVLVGNIGEGTLAISMGDVSYFTL